MYVQYNFKIYILKKKNKRSLTFGIEEREGKRKRVSSKREREERIHDRERANPRITFIYFDAAEPVTMIREKGGKE
jgi:hypothetical protein